MSETIIGLEAFERRLKDMTAVTQRQYLLKATRAGAAVIRAEAERRAPRRKGSGGGRLAKEEILATAEAVATEVIVKIGPSSTAWYGIFQELGTVHHRAQPFLLPAFEEKKAEALDVAGYMLKVEIEKV